MHYGAFLNLLTYAPEDWERQLREIDALGLDHVELWLEFEPTRTQLMELADLLGTRSTIMHGPFIGMSLASDWQQLARISCERLDRAIEAAGYLGCAVLTAHCGTVQIDEPRAVTLDRLTKRLERWADLSGPLIAIENMPARGGATREAVSTVAELSALIDRLPDLHVTVDVGHALQNGDAVQPFIHEHARSIANVHLHDGRHGGKAHRRLGSGELELDSFLATLDEVSYDRYVTLETIGAEDTAVSWSLLQSRIRERAVPA